MASAFNLSALATYVKDNERDLITKTYFETKIYDYLTRKGAKVQTGIKTKERLHYFSSDVTFQNDTGCGFNPLGTDTFTDRDIEVGAIKVDKEYCPRDLRPYWTQSLLNPGSLGEREGGAWEAIVAEANMKAIQEKLSIAYVKGDKASGDANLNKFDGILKQSSVGFTAANTAALMGGAAATAIDETNIRKALRATWRSLPTNLKGQSDVVTLIGTDLYEMFIAALEDANLYHFVPGEVQNYEMKIPGTGYSVAAFPEFDGTDTILSFRASNLYFGTDLENEEEKFEMKYNEHDEKTRFKAAFKAGVNFAFPAEVVRFEV